MLVGCLSIFLLLFLLPVFGFNDSNSLFIFLVVFFLGHLFMMGRHGSHSEHNDHRLERDNQSQNKKDHATHQH
nr:DUF2933 domain-containing protein [Roseivirga seohaensis]